MKGEVQFCSVLAKARGLDPAGYSASAKRFFALENPLPWPKGMWFDPKHVPAAIPKLFETFDALSPEERAALSIRPLMVAPDEAYTPEEYRRFWLWGRPEGAFADYRRTEYLVPKERLSDFIWAALMDTKTLPDFESYRVHATCRDFLVCTQGAVDAACGKFGYRLYQQAREMAQYKPNVRVWRAAHFGGHVFAPTVLELPAARCWAHLGTAELEVLMRLKGDIGILDGHYRGWAGLASPFLQVAEKALMLEHGWTWLDAPKAGEVVEEGDGWAEVNLKAKLGGKWQTFNYRVTQSHVVETPAKTGVEEVASYPQYRAVALAPAR